MMLREIVAPHRDRDGKRTVIRIFTTLQRAQYSAKDVLQLYHRRWAIENDIRDIKISLNAAMLRSKSPATVRLEVASIILAVNLLRGVIMRAAERVKVKPRQISFRGAVQVVQACAPLLRLAGRAVRTRLLHRMIDLIASQRVGTRPGRSEPRAVKKRPDRAYPLLMLPRPTLC